MRPLTCPPADLQGRGPASTDSSREQKKRGVPKFLILRDGHVAEEHADAVIPGAALGTLRRGTCLCGACTGRHVRACMGLFAMRTRPMKSPRCGTLTRPAALSPALAPGAPRPAGRPARRAPSVRPSPSCPSLPPALLLSSASCGRGDSPDPSPLRPTPPWGLVFWGALSPKWDASSMRQSSGCIPAWSLGQSPACSRCSVKALPGFCPGIGGEGTLQAPLQARLGLVLCVGDVRRCTTKVSVGAGPVVRGQPEELGF